MDEKFKRVELAFLYVLTCLAPFVLNGCRGVPDQHGMVLFERGEARCVILVAAEADESERTAAGELADYLLKITGARFNVLDEKYGDVKGAAIHVGPTKLAKSLDLVPEDSERWHVRESGDNLVLCGGRPRGTLYAVWHFLEDEMGVHWWTPWAETVPWRQTARIGDLDVDGRPAFQYRDVYTVEQASPALFHFMTRNRINGHFSHVPPAFGGSIRCGSAASVGELGVYLPAAATTDAPPINGGSLAEKIVGRIEKEVADARRQGLSPPEIYDLSPSAFFHEHRDGGGNSEDRSLETSSFLDLVNQVAGPVTARSPDRSLGIVAFGDHLLPKRDLKLHENVIVRICDHPTADYRPILTEPVTSSSHQLFREALERWGDTGGTLFVWDYLAPLTRFSGMPAPTIAVMGKNYPFYRRAGVKGIFSQTGLPSEGGLYDMKLWTQTKLMENPERDVDALIKTFADGYYGDDAGPLIVEYLRNLEKAAEKWPIMVNSFLGSFNFLSHEFIIEQHELFDDARAEVDRDPMLRNRVDEAGISLDYATLRKWRNLCLAVGVDDVDLDRDVILERYRDSMVRVLIHWYSGDALNRMNAWLRKRVARLAAFNGSAPLPQELANLSEGKVVEFQPPGFFRHGRPAEFMDDPNSPTGTAVRVKCRGGSDSSDLGAGKLGRGDLLAFTLSEAFGDKRVEVTKGFVTLDDVKESGYRDYLIMSDVPIGTRSVLEASFGQGVLVDLSEAVLASDDNVRVDLRVTMKLSGNIFPHGGEGEGAVDVARVIAVRR